MEINTISNLMENNMKRVLKKIDTALNKVIWYVLTGTTTCSKDCVLDGIKKVPLKAISK